MFHCSIIQRGSKQSRIWADIKKKIFVSCIHCFSRDVSHSSSSAQPQSPGPNQWQFQHVKASKSMDLGTTQNQQPTGGERLLCLCSAWRLHGVSSWQKIWKAWLAALMQSVHLQLAWTDFLLAIAVICPSEFARLAVRSKNWIWLFITQLLQIWTCKNLIVM